MSVLISAEVWRSSAYEGGTLITLLALADYANDEHCAWPSTASLARKTRQNERTVRRCLRRLQQDGVISIVLQAGPCSSNRYRIHLDRLQQRATLAEDPGAMPAPVYAMPGEGGHLRPKGEGVMPANPSIEPSKNRQGVFPSDDGEKQNQPQPQIPRPESGIEAATELVARELRIVDERLRKTIAGAIGMIVTDTGLPGDRVVARLLDECRQFRASPRFAYGGWSMFFGQGLWTMGRPPVEPEEGFAGYRPRKSERLLRQNAAAATAAAAWAVAEAPSLANAPIEEVHIEEGFGGYRPRRSPPGAPELKRKSESESGSGPKTGELR